MGALAIHTEEKDTLLGPAERAEFIDALYAHFSVQKACEKTGYDIRRVMETSDNDADFQDALNKAERHLAVIGEDELKRRAIHGVESVVVANGRVVYQVQDGVRVPMKEVKYSDSLLKLYLEANKRDRYGQKLEVTTTHKGHIALPTFSPEMMQLLLADARGEKIELVVDDNAGSSPEVMDAEFEEQEPAQETETVTASDDDGLNEFDIL